MRIVVGSIQHSIFPPVNYLIPAFSVRLFLYYLTPIFIYYPGASISFYDSLLPHWNTEGLPFSGDHFIERNPHIEPNQQSSPMKSPTFLLYSLSPACCNVIIVATTICRTSQWFSEEATVDFFMPVPRCRTRYHIVRIFVDEA